MGRMSQDRPPDDLSSASTAETTPHSQPDHNNDTEGTALRALRTHLALSFLEFGLPCFKLVPWEGARICLIIVGFCLSNSAVPLYVSNQNFHVLGKISREIVRDLRDWLSVKTNTVHPDLENENHSVGTSSR